MIPRAVFEQTLLGFFAPIRPYLEEDGVSEIVINGPDTVFVERRGKLERAPVSFASREDLMSALRNLAQYVGRHFDEQRPVLEARLPDGSRVEAIIPPAAPDGPCVAIRRFFRDTLTAQRLLELGSIDEDTLTLLRALVGGKQNVIVAGGTASGKTSLLNVLSSFFPSHERVVVIEDARELELQQPHVVNLESQPADARGRGGVSIRQLFQATLRMRPDRIVVGEIRGGEALDLIQAMTSGHGGCLSTVHATHAHDVLTRLETMALMSDVQLPLRALRAQLASAINVIVLASRLPDGSRCVTGVSEIVGHDDQKGYVVNDLVTRVFERADGKGRMRSRLIPTGVSPRCAPLLDALGYDLPASMRPSQK